MGLYVDLRITSSHSVGTKRIALLAIHRTEHLTNPSDPLNEEHPYDVKAYDEDMHIVKSGICTHRYGDGAWALVAKAMQSLELDDPLIDDFRPRMQVA